MAKRRLLLALGITAGLTAALVDRMKRATNPYRLRSGYPGVAVVTGASSGIGAEFARQLAARSYDLILVARREERLQALAQELTSSYGVRAQVRPADLSDPQAVERLADQLAQESNLSMLVNNAGYSVGKGFAQVDPQAQQNMIQVMVNASVRLARAVLPGMLSRRFGAIIQVSSVASFLPYPGNHTYGAAKAYQTFMSQSLNMQTRSSGVVVQSLCPGFTRTEFHDEMDPNEIRQIPGFLWLKAEDVVRDSLNALQTGDAVVVPGAQYKVAVFFANSPWFKALLPYLVQALGAFFPILRVTEKEKLPA